MTHRELSLFLLLIFFLVFSTSTKFSCFFSYTLLVVTCKHIFSTPFFFDYSLNLDFKNSNIYIVIKNSVKIIWRLNCHWLPHPSFGKENLNNNMCTAHYLHSSLFSFFSFFLLFWGRCGAGDGVRQWKHGVRRSSSSTTHTHMHCSTPAAVWRVAAASSLWKYILLFFFKKFYTFFTLFFHVVQYIKM